MVWVIANAMVSTLVSRTSHAQTKVLTKPAVHPKVCKRVAFFPALFLCRTDKIHNKNQQTNRYPNHLAPEPSGPILLSVTPVYKRYPKGGTDIAPSIAKLLR